jgi:iron complex outermembrane receptor protein
VSRLDSRVAALFGELRIPLVPPSARIAGIEQARMSLAARYERYAGLGSALTPRVGLDWSPVRHLTLEGSWGRSFAAPDLADLDQSANQLAITVLPDPKSPSGASPVLLWTGGNADLQNETATTWTAGARIDALEGRLSLDLTYFHIDYVGRIERVDYSASFLTDPIYAALVTRNPDAVQRRNACSRGVFLGAAADCTAAPVAALIDMRLNNVAATETSGLDLAAKYRTRVGAGDLEAGANAARLFTFRRTQFAGTAPQDLLDTTGNPIDLRVRGTLSLRRGAFGVAGAVNYFDSYRDTYSNPERPIGSWTTVDMQVTYRVADRSLPGLDGVTLVLAAQNVLNTNPPFVNNPAGVGFDPENADLIGRLLSLTLRKAW